MVAGEASKRICVIGAGPCGLTTLKNLRAEGFSDIVCYEAAQDIGGNWLYSAESGHSSVYASTHLISSKKLSQFEDFPMPAHYPDFPSHREMLAYFRSYAVATGALPFIRFGKRVTSAKRNADGRWQIECESGQEKGTDIFDYLFVCTGHHSDPVLPAEANHFTGQSIHSHDYKTAKPFEDARVLVVGGGNSACDIAVDVSRVAAKTAISMRRGYHIIPKLVFGMPVDIAYRKLRRLPKPLRQWLLDNLLRLMVGPWERYGLPEPERKVLEMHPTLNSDVLLKIRHGDILPRSGIKEIRQKHVVFADGSTEEFDGIIWATGYRTSFPFFESAFIDWREALRLPLYLKMMLADVPNLYFIGLFQPIGCIWTLADLQARIAALEIAGRLSRPTDIAARIAHEMTHAHWRFEERPRHAAEVDYHDFRKELLRTIAHATPPSRYNQSDSREVA